MSLFEIVLIVVCVVTIPLAAVLYFPVGRLFKQVGRRGGLWFDHLDETTIEDRPSEDDLDDPIPKRPLRGRPS